MIRRTIILLLMLLAVASVAVDVVGRTRLVTLALQDRAESLVVLAFVGGQLELWTYRLGDLSGHDGQSVASLRAGFQQSKAAVKGGSLSGWRPSGRYFYRDSKHRLTIGTNLPGGGKSVKIFWYTVYGMPNWLLTVGLLIYPTIAFIRGPLRRWSQRRRHRQGLCTNCGYDLTGNTSGVCPECGHAV